VTALGLFGLVAAGVFALSWPLATLACTVLFGGQEHRGLFFVSLLGLVFNLLFTLELNYVRLLKKPWVFLWVSLVKSLLFLGFNVLLVVVYHKGVAGIVWGTLLSLAIVSIPVAAVILGRVGFGFSRPVLRSMIRFALPLLPARLADISIQFTDKYFLNRFFSTALVGQYALGNRLCSLLQMLIAAPFAQVWVVRRLETLGKETEAQRFDRIFTYFFVLITMAALGLALFGPEIVTLISTPSYLPASTVVPILSLAFVLMPVDMHFQIAIIHAKKTELLLGISVLCALLNIPLMYLGVSRLGMIGASLALLLGGVIRAGLSAWGGRRYCHVPMEFDGRAVGAVLGGAVISYLVMLAAFGSTLSMRGVLAKLAVLGAFPVVIALTPVFTAQERQDMLRLGRRLWSRGRLAGPGGPPGEPGEPTA
jgi:O-antigen/teichoic acid export membrane protein